MVGIVLGSVAISLQSVASGFYRNLLRLLVQIECKKGNSLGVSLR